jgi:tetratricopeptide (TPR) repeat protein
MGFLNDKMRFLNDILHRKDTYYWMKKADGAHGRIGSAEIINAYDRALSINPQNTTAWYRKGLIFASNGKYAEAVEAYDRAIEINPQYAEAWYNKGSALYSQGKYAEAVEAYDRVIGINPKDGSGPYLLYQANCDRRIAVCCLVAEINPGHADAWYNKGVALYGRDKYYEAIEAYDRAIEINPQYAEAWYNKGITLGIKGRYDEAIKAYDRAIEINPKDESVKRYKAVAQENLKKSEEARNIEEEARNIEEFERSHPTSLCNYCYHDTWSDGDGNCSYCGHR